MTVQLTLVAFKPGTCVVDDELVVVGGVLIPGVRFDVSVQVAYSSVFVLHSDTSVVLLNLLLVLLDKTVVAVMIMSVGARVCCTSDVRRPSRVSVGSSCTIRLLVPGDFLGEISLANGRLGVTAIEGVVICGTVSVVDLGSRIACGCCVMSAPDFALLELVGSMLTVLP